MAGTIYSLALSQRFDTQGRLLINAPLYLYEANTTTPVDSYRNSGLTILNPWPLRTDSAGMIPEFWLEDGSYRARLTDAAGAVVYFDLMNVLALGPSSGGGGGGGGGIDQNAIFQTGDELWQKRSGARPGWVRQNARTIGSASSGATERANADTQPLFEYLWNNFSNELCPVTGGRGVSAAADFAANKAIATPDMRGCGPIGLDDMGNAAAGILADGTPTAPGTGGGAEKRTLPRSALPNVTLSVTGTTSTASAHRHRMATQGTSTGHLRNNPERAVADVAAGQYQLGSLTAAPTLGWSGLEGDHGHTVSGTTSSINDNVAQTPVNIMSPYRLGTWFIKL